MSIVWTTIALIALLLPGVFFFIGLATYERLSREIIRSGVVSEIALASVVAVVLHTVCISLLSASLGFRLSHFVMPLATMPVSSKEFVLELSHRLLPAVFYFLATASIGFVLGAITAVGIVRGWLRFLAKHKWIYDIIDRDRKGGIVTAFVMTTTVEDGKVLMYRGRIHEIFLLPDGKISYVILKNCARFYMTFEAEAPTTGKQLELFSGDALQRRIWDYLLIDGNNIANILFDPSSEKIRASEEGRKALKEAMQQELERRLARELAANQAALRERVRRLGESSAHAASRQTPGSTEHS
jgi:hypothetical protein